MIKEDILKALSTIQDTTVGKNIVELGIVDNIVLAENLINFSINLHPKNYHLKDKIYSDSIEVLKKECGEKTEINIHFSLQKNAPEPIIEGLKNVKHILAVVSGKGGVGKSTIAANLAMGLSLKGYKVGILDADIYGPSMPIMFGLRGERPKLIKQENSTKPLMIPIEKFGVKVLSIGFLIEEKDALVWRGPMASSAVKQLISDVYWGELDYLIIDMPPGTGDIHLTLVQSAPITAAIVVSTPQDVALIDAKKAIAMFAQAKTEIPILGIVENMSYFQESENSAKHFIFGENGAKQLAEELDIPLLGQIPLVEAIRKGGDSGKPFVSTDLHKKESYFLPFVEEVLKKVSYWKDIKK